MRDGLQVIVLCRFADTRVQRHAALAMGSFMGGAVQCLKSGNETDATGRDWLGRISLFAPRR
jgi:hypothetical protein